MNVIDEERVAEIAATSKHLEELVSKGNDMFANDITHRWAVERALQNISDTCNRFSENCKSQYSELNWRELTSIKTYLNKSFHRVDERIIWHAATQIIPHLVTTINKS